MNARRKCEICGHFKEFGFTEIGLICEDCFKAECAKRSYNNGMEAAAKIAETWMGISARTNIDIAKGIRSKKEKEHRLKELK